MSQHDYNIANQGFSSFRSDLNNALSAIQTTNSGTSRPTGAVAGQLWLDTTSATSPTLKYYDGADDISLATIDHTANTVNWLDSTVSITGLSTTATGTVLTLSDSASTSTVNLIIDNQKEVRFRETTANGTNYIGLKAPASVSADLTFTLPSADGTSGQVLTTNGSGVLSFATVAGTAWQSVQTTGFTAVSGYGYPCNTTSSAFTITLPASPSVGSYVQIVDYAGTFSTNNITLGANSNKINGVVGNKILSTNREAVTLTYVDATQGWVSTSASNYGSQSLDPLPYSVDFLVVAGGGGGGGGSGSTYDYPAGAGGAGGFRTSTQSFGAGTVITVTVGDGGAGRPNETSTRGANGSDSSISGSGLTTITSSGGGGGGASTPPYSSAVNDGGSGGSGGAGGINNISTATGGSGNTPSTSPSQGSSGSSALAVPPSGSGGAGGSGAGGASAVGITCSGNNGGNGGNGSASSITGSSVTYAGGGSGGARNAPASVGTAGTGGGGTGGAVNANGSNGTANLGGGGGGRGSGSTNAGSGGKGVVILSIPTSNYSSTTTGSPTVTTSGSNTILTFTGSGTYTG
jgi:hypothetical protein